MSERDEPFVLDFGIKTIAEVEHDGEMGLMVSGYASRFNEVDLAGEWQMQGAFDDISDTWGAEREPLVIFQHGLSAELGTRRIGKAVKHHVDEQGLFVQTFIPKTPRFKDATARKKFGEIYEGIKAGVIRGYSVGGTYLKGARGAIKRWSTGEVSITPSPCLPTAVFTVGTKAITDSFGALPNILSEASTAGILTRPHWSAAMRTAQDDADGPLHDHLLSCPAHEQGYHNPDECSLCQDRRAMTGMKAVTKAEPDGRHPSSHYLFVGDPAVVGTWKLRYKNAAGEIEPRLLGACHAALTVGYRGEKVDLPDDEKKRCLARLKRLYAQEGLDWPETSSGGKTDLTALADPALRVAQLLEQGQKAGRRHSAATLDAVRQVIALITETFGLEPSGDAAATPEDAMTHT